MTKVIIFHSPLLEDAPIDEWDVLDEAEFFRAALQELNYSPEIIAFPYDLEEVGHILESKKPLFVVNLVETLFSSGRLVHLGPFIFEHFDISYTGCDAHSMYLSSHKILSKQYMRTHDIPTPDWYIYSDLKKGAARFFGESFLLKSLWEHASFGMDESKKLLFSDETEMLKRFEQEKKPKDFFCEQYIHGREFNISILGGINGPEVLPVAEIRFYYPEDKARILGYKAKWEEDSFEYKNTRRSFDFEEIDRSLISDLERIAIRCWNVFGLKGYARVDFRVDTKGNIFVLEINANPCISPDSGLVAAASKAGLSQTQLVQRILEDMQGK